MTALLALFSGAVLLVLPTESHCFPDGYSNPWQILSSHALSFDVSSDNVAISATVGLTDENLLQQERCGHQDLAEMEQQIKNVLEKVIPATVAVDNGSGILIRADGLILTAAHVLLRSEGLAQVTLPDGRRQPADILGVDLHSDTALVKLVGRGPWPSIPLADFPSEGNPNRQFSGFSGEPIPADSLGHWCLAVGYPSAFTRGKPAVARLGRILKRHDRLLNTDCTLMGGDSGGPLVNLSGELIAIHTAIRSELNQNYHRPVSHVRSAWEISSDLSGRVRKRNVVDRQNAIGNATESKDRSQILGHSELSDPLTNPLTNPLANPLTIPLGQPNVSIGLNAETDGSRVRVRRVVGASAAFSSGLQTEDVILKLGEKPIRSFSQFQQALLEFRGRQSVDMIINRYGRLIRLRLDLQKVVWPEEPDEQVDLNSKTQPSDSREGLLNRSSDRSNPILEPQASDIETQPAVDRWADIITELGRPYEASVVEIFGQHQRLALGTVVSAEGFIVTKHSLLEPVVEVKLPDQRRLAAELVRFDVTTDLALLKIQGDPLGLTPVDWQHAARQIFPTQGKLMLSIHPAPQSTQMGMVITSEHQLNVPTSASDGRFVWGVDFQPEVDQQFFQTDSRTGYHRGLRVKRVKPRFLGESCNLLQGDLVTAVNGKNMQSVNDFDDLTSSLTAGQPIELSLVRGQRAMQLNVVAQSSWTRSAHDLWGGGAFSNRRFGLGEVVIHDIPIDPNQQGGLLIDIEGNLVGINLARSLRTATIAIPFVRLVEFLEME